MTILIVPGLHGSEPDHWQSHWEAELYNAERVQQENWSSPDFNVWLATLVRHIREKPGAILVGHSLGATLVAHLAAQHPNLDIGGALLVAPADPELTRPPVPELASFGPLPLDPFHFPAFVIASRTDPYMAPDRARVLANAWEAAFVDVGDAGHINVASGHGAWPEGRRWLDHLRVWQADLQNYPRGKCLIGA
ncbi:RBBP9/YdeN family alpha/beta hydrolase (plasmid) [Microvirga sp. RSM25]|uniref:RBBP9/YdeN family alpha/beta hydrolase n=1 Tax=Microvirga sp. RSM25 TaxID=3273802 RepID=UPI0038505B72